MPEATQIVFKHKELAEILVKSQSIHDGIWGLYIRFGIGASNVGPSEADLQPAAIVPVLEIGLQKFDKETNLSVDAAKVNPAKESTIIPPAKTTKH
jgi:hypothetical protein